MAFGAIEFTKKSIAHDYSTIKHNEYNKGMIDQGHIVDHVQKTTEQRTKEVQGSDDTRWQERKPDAREKGSNEYSGDGGRRRNKDGKSKERMVVKNTGGFDMKI